MTYVLDPKRYWQDEWESKNAEPHPFGPWTIEQALERVAWLDKKWEAYGYWKHQQGFRS